MSKALDLAFDIEEIYTGFTAQEAAKELRRLAEVETAFLEWLDKSEWIQETAQSQELGMHRADAMRKPFNTPLIRLID